MVNVLEDAASAFSSFTGTYEKEDQDSAVLRSGLPEGEKENAKETIRDFFLSTLRIPDSSVSAMKFYAVHRLPRPRIPENADPEDPRVKFRPMMVAFLSVQDREVVLSNGGMLAGKKISMKIDLPTPLREKRRRLEGIAYKLRQEQHQGGLPGPPQGGNASIELARLPGGRRTVFPLEVLIRSRSFGSSNNFRVLEECRFHLAQQRRLNIEHVALLLCGVFGALEGYPQRYGQGGFGGAPYGGGIGGAPLGVPAGVGGGSTGGGFGGSFGANGPFGGFGNNYGGGYGATSGGAGGGGLGGGSTGGGFGATYGGHSPIAGDFAGSIGGECPRPSSSSDERPDPRPAGSAVDEARSSFRLSAIQFARIRDTCRNKFILASNASSPSPRMRDSIDRVRNRSNEIMAEHPPAKDDVPSSLPSSALYHLRSFRRGLQGRPEESHGAAQKARAVRACALRSASFEAFPSLTKSQIPNLQR
ncbi:unnamed protein product [Darwinula stevensoni]|uniref:Uncharacterized protein n=1 Tax=Darwinula stevensoni TaxID=69355 RepID=A0A7R8XF74_9CRUS|nr:unnamed protein product [Darwinula stevensoni]CAG0895008.1 unnamed protein product [Darwinula stevensoni]